MLENERVGKQEIYNMLKFAYWFLSVADSHLRKKRVMLIVNSRYKLEIYK